MKIYRSKVYNVYIENINIKLSVDLDDLSNANDNRGYIQITSVYTSNKNSCFWDNLDFFIYNNKKIIKKDCKQELINKNLYVKEIFGIIENLINEAMLENMLTKTNKND